MRLAVLSDIHGNLNAFEEVLKDIDSSRIDKIFCLGDNIGYGPQPEEVVKLIQERRIPSVMGNHEWGIFDKNKWDDFNPLAQKSLTITRQLISAGTLQYSKTLKPFLIHDDCRFVHGCPPDLVFTYLYTLSLEQIHDLLLQTRETFCFVGHTHDLVYYQYDGYRTTRHSLGRDRINLNPDYRYLFNIGSVGQPRDGDDRAKYVILDTKAHALEVRYITYDVAYTADRIIELGFPELFARRLWGVKKQA